MVNPWEMDEILDSANARTMSIKTFLSNAPAIHNFFHTYPLSHPFHLPFPQNKPKNFSWQLTFFLRWMEGSLSSILSKQKLSLLDLSFTNDALNYYFPISFPTPDFLIFLIFLLEKKFVYAAGAIRMICSYLQLSSSFGDIRQKSVIDVRIVIKNLFHRCLAR